MHQLRSAAAAQQLDRSIGDHLVGVHVGGRAGTRLEHVHDELVVQLPFCHLRGRPGDGLGQAGLQQGQLSVDLGGAALDEPEGGDGAGEPQPADGEVVTRIVEAP
jgi:hypothetical protein